MSKREMAAVKIMVRSLATAIRFFAFSSWQPETTRY